VGERQEGMVGQADNDAQSPSDSLMLFLEKHASVTSDMVGNYGYPTIASLKNYSRAIFAFGEFNDLVDGSGRGE
jgi:hypothetical protein